MNPVQQQGAARPQRIMDHNQQTWILAKRMLEQHGQHAMHGARAVSATLRDPEGYGSAADCLEIVCAMDFLLSDDGNATVH